MRYTFLTWYYIDIQHCLAEDKNVRLIEPIKKGNNFLVETLLTIESFISNKMHLYKDMSTLDRTQEIIQQKHKSSGLDLVAN